MTTELVCDEQECARSQLLRLRRLNVDAQQVREEIQNLQQVFFADLVLDHFQDESIALELEVRVVEYFQRLRRRRRVELEHRRVKVGKNVLYKARGLFPRGSGALSRVRRQRRRNRVEMKAG